MADSIITALNRALKADPEGAPVYEAELTREEARAWIDNAGELEGHALMDEVDRAQGALEEDTPAAFLVLRIRA